MNQPKPCLFIDSPNSYTNLTIRCTEKFPNTLDTSSPKMVKIGPSNLQSTHQDSRIPVADEGVVIGFQMKIDKNMILLGGDDCILVKVKVKVKEYRGPIHNVKNRS